ncbi:peroxisomal leader peptide-processing protease isoform X2 [Microplitis demolitor]|uniref:peroxisomal leader peptide-processing protease isoform X2 n=1 Tax=Microplitis demolitor TaxID=69319 RepID=UPI00235B6B3A|nr:peroxisomal leader peptide-processing protease isoform X2 [Microplitis demolitor]
MEPKSVAISLVEKNSNEIEYTSGIQISEDWILAPGTLLKSKIEDQTLLDFISALPSGEIKSLREENLQVQVQSCAMTESREITEIKSTKGSIAGLWSCPLLADSLANLYSSKSLNENFERLNKILLPIFLVVRLDRDDEKVNNVSECSVKDIYQVLSCFFDSHLSGEDYKRGDDVQVESTPFGNPVFINSVSKGIVSNVLGVNNCIMLTDANAVPGCEGGPVYAARKNGSRVIYGMVIAPMTLCRSEWVNYTFVACLLPCLKKLLRKQEPKNNFLMINQQNTDITDKSVVLIYCGSEWGSGILLDRDTGTILTCSHVIDQAPNRRIKVVFGHKDLSHGSKKSQWAKLIYRTPKGIPYDIAVIKVDPLEISNYMQPLKIRNTAAVKGESVISAGFPFLYTSLPTITHGNISNVSPYMLQTTCYVQSGTSGGPIIRPNTGELLGIIVCNVTTFNTLYPRTNMAIPATIFSDPINQYIKTERVQAFDTLMTQDKDAIRMWNCFLLSRI